jgi:CubicO group peptidase (beta-lactamase class C family)
VRVKIHPTVFVVACTLACAGWLTTRPAEQVRIADKYMRAQAIAALFSGTVLVARGDEVVFARGYGYADLERGIPNDVRTQYRIGSVTKPFTAVTILQLQEEGLLSVADPICRYFSPCPAAWAPITIHQLLSHTSGIPDLTAREDYLVATAVPASRDEVLATFRDLPLRFAPAEKFEYSNSNYHLLGAIVERVSGQRFIDVLTQRTLEPLGLSATFMETSSPAAAHVAVGYRPADDGSLHPDSPLDPSWSFTSGALFSTVEDLHRWSRALDTDELLPPASRTLMWTPVQATYAYGWTVDGPSTETLNRRVQRHAGRSQGYTACFVRFPDDNLTAIVLSNNVMADTCPIVRDLAAIVLGEPYKIPIARRAIRLDPAILDRYTGRYRYTDNIAINIVREDDLLVAWLGQSADHFQLLAESETDFFFKTLDAQAEFVASRAGEVRGMAISYNNQRFYAERLPESRE